MEMPPAGPPLLEPAPLTANSGAPAPGDFPAAGDSLGRYLLLNELHRGDIASVFLAHDPALDRSVAIKLPRRLDAPALAQFRYTARALARMPQAGIVTLYEWLDSAYGPALVLEYLVGRSLAACLAERGRLSVPEAVNVFDPILAAVEQLHRVGVAHGAITPAHIFITTDRRVKLLGFGGARALDPAGAHAADDLSGVSASLYAALLNKPTNADGGKEVPDLKALTPALQRLLARATDADPRRRLPSARALRRALAEAAGTPAGKAWPRLTRHLLSPVFLRWRALNMEFLLVLALAALVLGLGLYPRERPLADPVVQKKSVRPAPPTAPAMKNLPQPVPAPERPPDRYRDLRQAWGSQEM